ncbi:MAG: flagellar export chaperone FlgN [Candidatus Lernaella stagnicola]|nr:flagellar export chaperone FlgN [Candidatus Lernaella stagnicola]
MNTEYQKLIAVLGEQLAAFSDLRVLLEQEKGAIACFDTEGLATIVGAKVQLHNRVQELDYQRQEIASGIAQALGLEEKATLKQLAEHAPGKLRDTLLKVRHVFGQLADDMAGRIQDNGERINHSLRLVINLRRLIIQEIQEPPTYEEIVRGPTAHGPSVAGSGRI